jgi:NAD(P)-dependent dehydrogenase (short-subunit alcohol dehydrogenase family)
MAIKGVRMPAQELSGTTALVTGASRGFGRAIAVALSKHDAHVAVARDHGRLEELRALLGDTFTPVAADPVVASQLLDKHRPRTLVLNAGAAPLPRPVHRQTWQIFSRNWEVDVQHVFNWTRGALLLPLQPGSAVIAISSGAAVNGPARQRRAYRHLPPRAGHRIRPRLPRRGRDHAPGPGDHHRHDPDPQVRPGRRQSDLAPLTK